MKETIFFIYIVIGLFTSISTFVENHKDHFVITFWKAIAAFILWPVYHAAVLLYILVGKLTSKN